MTRHVREFVDISNYASLESLIETLVAIRDSVPEGDEVEVQVRGDDNFGRRLSVSFMRRQTAEEAACDARYADFMAAALPTDIENMGLAA